MVLRLQLLLSTVAGGLLLLSVLCLGAQNLDERPSLNLGFGQRSAPLPSGFLVGIALVMGVISGGCCGAMLTPGSEDERRGRS
jgi:hypothetical protein